MVTHKRREWWDNLSPKEKYLREEIWILKDKRRLEKAKLNGKFESRIMKKYGTVRINNLSAHIRALKHELDRETAMVYTGQNEGVLPIYRCKKCGGTTIDFECYCPYCGRKIKG